MTKNTTFFLIFSKKINKLKKNCLRVEVLVKKTYSKQKCSLEGWVYR